MSYSWRPVAPLSEQDRQIDLRDVDALQSAWLEFRSRLAETSAANLKAFNERLARQWSIETGILERLYDIDRGTTQVLIERGFVTDYLERSSTNHEPEQVMQILRDHQASVELIQDAVGNTRPLTVGLIQQLHATLTQHQETVAGLDQFGNPVQFRLRRGAFKELPNNPTRPNGVLHEYAPPIHVSAEMDNLVQWYNQAQGKSIPTKTATGAWRVRSQT